MGHWTWIIEMLINVFFQAVNLVIFFWIFKYFFADKIISAVEERKQMLDKIKNAEKEYNDIVENAKSESESIINKALDHENKIIEEAKSTAEKKKEEIIQQAQKEADKIKDSAKEEFENYKKELEENWEEWVKRTSKEVVKKIFGEDKSLQDEYISKLAKDFKKQ